MSADGVAAILNENRDAKYATVDQLRELFQHFAERRSDEHRTTSYTGHCGWTGPGDADGFDDGYDMMGRLPANWTPLSTAGDWPYYIFWADGRQRALLSYCERDFELVVADDDDAYRQLLARTIATVPAP